MYISICIFHTLSTWITLALCMTITKAQPTVLVKKHPDGYAAHVEAVQKVLHVLAGDGVCAIGLFVLHNTLGHGRHDVVVSVTNLYNSIRETGTGKPHVKKKSLPPGRTEDRNDLYGNTDDNLLICDFFTITIFVLELQHVLKTLHIPGMPQGQQP